MFAWLTALFRFHGAALDMYGRERLRLVFSAGMALLCGEAAPSVDDAWPLVEPTIVSPKHLSWRDKMQRRVLAFPCEASGCEAAVSLATVDPLALPQVSPSAWCLRTC